MVSVGLDILPTVCDYAGVPTPPHCLGHSLRPLVEGRPVDTWRHYVVAENDFSRMVCTVRSKYVSYGPGSGDEQLFDLVTDPGEMVNRADDPQ